jgi:ketosteroid isomerase-like protein
MLPFAASRCRAGLLAGLLLLACAGPGARGQDGSYPPPPPPPVPGAAEIEAAVRAVLDAQVAAWNRGDVRGFMDGYSRRDTLIMISDGTLRRGWQETLYAYMRNYPDQASMGTLSFEDVRVRPLTPDYALAYGIWRLRRAEDEPMGLFSLLFRETAEGWKIIHDHTSSAP